MKHIERVLEQVTVELRVTRLARVWTATVTDVDANVLVASQLYNGHAALYAEGRSMAHAMGVLDVLCAEYLSLQKIAAHFNWVRENEETVDVEHRSQSSGELGADAVQRFLEFAPHKLARIQAQLDEAVRCHDWDSVVTLGESSYQLCEAVVWFYAKYKRQK